MGTVQGRPLTAILRAHGLFKRYDRTAALDGFDLEVGRAEFVALLGPSGSGKSTLLRMIAGFEMPDAGTLELDGRDVLPLPPSARPCAMVFQSYALFPHLSVLDNVGYGLRRRGVGRDAVRARVTELLSLLRLDGLERRRPEALSGGQRQRVALARALAPRPPLLLLDEPLAALDAELRERTGAELRALQRTTGAAFLMVTHDQAEALALADRVAVMEAGRVAQCASPAALYARPATRSVARFLGAANVLEAVPAAEGRWRCAAIGAVLRPQDPVAPGGAFALRPERIVVLPTVPAENGVAGSVREASFRGEAWSIEVATATGQMLRVRLPAAAIAAPPSPGAQVALGWPADALLPLRA